MTEFIFLSVCGMAFCSLLLFAMTVARDTAGYATEAPPWRSDSRGTARWN